MGKGEETKVRIIEQAAGLFNQKGFTGASLADIMEATGLKKGGIYRHFGSKEQLALEAFDYAVARMGQRFGEALEGKRGALDRLMAIVSVYVELPSDPPVPGGCPVLSASVENDHESSPLRTRVSAALDGLRALIIREVTAGVKRGELKEKTDASAVATVVIAMLEGGTMLTQLYDEPQYINQAADHLKAYLGSLR